MADPLFKFLKGRRKTREPLPFKQTRRDELARVPYEQREGSGGGGHADLLKMLKGAYEFTPAADVGDVGTAIQDPSLMNVGIAGLAMLGGPPGDFAKKLLKAKKAKKWVHKKQIEGYEDELTKQQKEVLRQAKYKSKRDNEPYHILNTRRDGWVAVPTKQGLAGYSQGSTDVRGTFEGGVEVPLDFAKKLLKSKKAIKSKKATRASSYSREAGAASQSAINAAKKKFGLAGDLRPAIQIGKRVLSGAVGQTHDDIAKGLKSQDASRAVKGFVDEIGSFVSAADSGLSTMNLAATGSSKGSQIAKMLKTSESELSKIDPELLKTLFK